jgi:hypothetical protein
MSTAPASTPHVPQFRPAPHHLNHPLFNSLSAPDFPTVSPVPVTPRKHHSRPVIPNLRSPHTASRIDNHDDLRSRHGFKPSLSRGPSLNVNLDSRGSRYTSVPQCNLSTAPETVTAVDNSYNIRTHSEVSTVEKNDEKNVRNIRSTVTTHEYQIGMATQHKTCPPCALPADKALLPSTLGISDTSVALNTHTPNRRVALSFFCKSPKMVVPVQETRNKSNIELIKKPFTNRINGFLYILSKFLKRHFLS